MNRREEKENGGKKKGVVLTGQRGQKEGTVPGERG